MTLTEKIGIASYGISMLFMGLFGSLKQSPADHAIILYYAAGIFLGLGLGLFLSIVLQRKT